MTDDRRAKRLDVDPDLALPADVEAVFAGWATDEPPAGFVDRVVAATRLPHAPAPPAPRRRSGGAVGGAVGRAVGGAVRRAAGGIVRRGPVRRAVVAAAVLAAAAVAGSVALLGGGGSPQDGARVVQDRETIRLGDRGVAVAEPGTEITWTVSASGAAEVHQTRGDVFYRVEHGGPFAVETPYGRIIVRGTCFRVEVLNMSVSKQTWVGGAVGAALAATIVIAVYEGRVRVVNARGHADAGAGQHIALGAGAAPSRVDSPAVTLSALEPPPPGAATVEELLRRDQSHRGEIALLHARLQALEQPGTEPEPAAEDHRRGRRKIVDLSHDELVELVKDCEIRFDIPGYGIEPHLMSDKQAQASQVSADDRAIYDRTVRKENDRYMTALRALYQELVGGEPSDNLDSHALMLEILQKSPSADVEAARKRLAQERAGMVAAPAELAGRSVVERLFRLEISAGSTLEQLLAAELGPEKAHQLRTSGWAGGDDNILSGCPD